MNQKPSYEELEKRVKALEITAREYQQTRKALEEREGRRHFAQLSVEGTWCCKMDPPMPTRISTEEQVDWTLRHLSIDQCNDVFARMYGYASHTDVIGRKYGDIVAGDAEIARQMIREWVNQAYGFLNAKSREVTRTGKVMWFLKNAASVKDKEHVVWVGGTQIDISERRRIEIALHESEERFNSFFNNSPVGLGIWDSEFRYIFINDALQKINGRSREAHLGRTVEEVLPKAAPVIMPLFKRILATGEPALNMELSGEIPSRPDEISHYLISYFPISISRRRPDFIGGVVVDITDSKRTEQALELSNRRYQKLFHNSPVSLWEEDFSEVNDYLAELRDNGIVDLRAYLDDNPSQLQVLAQKIKILNVNQAAIKMHKAENKEDLLGNLEKLFTAQSFAAFKEEIIAIANGELKYETEGEVQTLDGEPIQVSISLSIDTDPPEPARAILATVDITARKKAHETIRKSEERLKRAQEAGKVGIWELDLRKQRATFSELFARIHGIKGHTSDLDTLMAYVPSEDQPAIERALKQAVEPGSEYNVEHRIIRQDTGDIRWVRARGRVTRQVNGEIHRISGTTQEITKRKRAEQERDKLQARINQIQRMESIGNLAGGIAHDFNNILSSIIGFTELALDDAQKGSLLEDNLLEVYTAGKRAKDLVKQILAFARQSDEELKPIQVCTIAKEALKLLRSSIPTSIDIKQHIRTDSFIMGNATQIHQIFMNMCTNAAHAMEDSGGTLKVSTTDILIDDSAEYPLSDLEPGEYIEITVSDTGKGISSEIIGSIYEPYFTSKPAGQGTGMGLAVVHGIVESYGGKITVESQLHKGAVFRIFLPIAKKRRSAVPTESEKVRGGHERVLFVDDESPIASLGGQLLKRLGYTVTTRTSSIEALQLFQSKPRDFDLVISDMTMPNMTGDELAIELMAIRPDIPVIICTGYSNKLSEEKAARIGIKAFAFKPMVKAELAKTIRQVLDGAKAPPPE